jgi:putative ABC transport system permease protein
MFGDWLAVAVRNLVRDGTFSAIGVAGLAVGVACFLLIALFVRHELSFDRYHGRAERIYRVSRDFLPTTTRPEIRLAAMPAPAGPLLELDFAEVEETARLALCGGGVLVSSGNVAQYERGFVAADAELFDIFDFERLHGDPAAALRLPNAAVLTESTARKYFGRTDVRGETLVLDGNQAVQVAAIIGDLPDNTHLRFDLLVPMRYLAAALGEAVLRQWSLNCFHTYALLRDGARVADIESRTAEFVDRHLGEGASKLTSFAWQPMTTVHLSSSREGEMSPPGSRTAVLAFGAVAAFVLALACINFMNLATARAARRAKEVGIRKVAGSGRAGLIGRFLGESILVSLTSVVAGLAIAQLFLPAFGAFVQKDLALDYGNPAALAWLGALALAVGLAAGSYPAFYLSAFNPARVLRGDVTRGEAAAKLRKLLVVTQFAISITLIISTVVVQEQTRYAQNIELGYDKERIVVLSGSPTRGLGTQWEALKREWSRHPQIVGVTASNLTPGTTNNNSVPVALAGRAEEPSSMSLMIVDFGFFETYGIDVIAGRTFSEDYGDDRLVPASADQRASANVVLSALGARRLGLTADEAVGRTLEAFGASATVVGIVADVRFESARNPVKPIVYAVPPRPQPGQAATLREASIRVTGRDLPSALSHIETKWRELVPDQPATLRFLDEDFDVWYRNEARQARILLASSVLAIFIACLGVLGLASFAVQQRRKEIGIRRAMGASALDIVRLFSSEIATLVLAANLVAWPVAYAIMHRWLEGFAYRIELEFTVFVGSAVLALIVCVLTAGATAASAALARPVHALRYE